MTRQVKAAGAGAALVVREHDGRTPARRVGAAQSRPSALSARWEVFVARDTAAEPIKKKIRLDREGLPTRACRLEALLAYAEDHLFEGLTVKALLKGAGIRDRNVAFSLCDTYLKSTLMVYVRRAQIGTAKLIPAVLLRDFNLEVPIGDIAAAVGIPNYWTFRDNWQRTADLALPLYKPPKRLALGFNEHTLSRLVRGKLSTQEHRLLLGRIPDSGVKREYLAADGEESYQKLSVIERAKARTIQKIQRDRVKVSKPFKEFLDIIAMGLFHGLTATGAVTDAEIKAKSFRDQFKFYLGETPKRYIKKRWVETAVCAFSESELLVKEVFSELGASSVRTAHRWFKEISGENPKDLCSCVMTVQIDNDTWRGAGRGQAAAVKTVTDFLVRELCDPQPIIIMDGAAFAERQLAEEVIWPELRELAYAAAHEKVSRYVFPHVPTALAEVLLKKYLPESRRDRQRGIQCTDLAQVSLKANLERGSLEGDEFHEESALTFACRGNALRLALAFPEAEAAFKKALEALRASPTARHSRQVYGLKGSLRSSQRHHEEAISLTRRALEMSEKSGNLQHQIHDLDCHAVAILYSESPEKAVPHLEKALEFFEACPEAAASLRFRITGNLANALVRSGSYQRATKLLKEVLARPDLSENPMWVHSLQWLAGNIDHDLMHYAAAEKKYLAARAGSEALGGLVEYSQISLDLAILYAEQEEKASEVVTIISNIVPFFEAFHLHDETMTSLGLLVEALGRPEMPEILRDLRSCLRSDPLLQLHRP